MKRTTLIICFLFVAIFSFLFGSYIGTINNNFIHNTKTRLESYKTLTINFVKSFNSKTERFHILLDNKEIKKIEKQKQHFLDKKVIIKKLAKWQKGKLRRNNEEYDIKIKLKGMFLDEFEFKDQRFSYSIKLNKKKIKNMSRFFIHYPEKRLKLHEWYGDQLLKYAGLIYHENDFISLKINEDKEELYLLEEKSSVQTLKRNKRPMGPIISFSTEKLRKSNQEKQHKQIKNNYSEAYYQSEIKPLFKDTHNLRAIQLLENYRSGELPPEKVFNMDKTARLFALAELVGYIHQLQFHNIKFYYNPDEDRLEPIANDFQFSLLSNWTSGLLTIDGFLNSNKHIVFPFSQKLLKNQKFINLVFKKLNIYRKSSFMEGFLKNIKNQEEEAKTAISVFDPFYVPQISFYLKQNIKHINYIIESKEELKFFKFLDKDTVINFKIKNYKPLIPISILKEKEIVYNFKNEKNYPSKKVNEPIKKYSFKIINSKISKNDSNLYFIYTLLGEEGNKTSKIH
jgi:hypothetical protein